MKVRPRCHGSLVSITLLMVAMGCSVDSKGLVNGGGVDASGAGARPGGTGGVIATGGTLGTGGAIGSGGTIGTGGSAGSGGTPGTGGDVGSGAVMGSGGSPGTGGVLGTGGGAAGRGGAGGRGGAVGTCDSSNCSNGCCSGNRCVINRTNNNCGAEGAACAPCTACFQCSNAGACVVNPTSLWTITCVSATIAPTKPGGQLWDGQNLAAMLPLPISTAPDPFCAFQLDGAAQVVTTVQTDTFTPSWDESITPAPADTRITPNFLVSEAGNWSVFVGDDDPGQARFENVCQVFPTLTAASFTSGTVRFSNIQSCTNLTIQLTCAQ